MNKIGKGGLGVAKKGGSKSAPTALPIQAMQLLGRWTRVAQGHISCGMSCSCSADFGNLQAKDMEQHILDYLDSKYRTAGTQEVCRLLAERAGYKEGEAGSISELLRAIASQKDVPVKEKDQLSMLADLERSIGSLDEMTGGTA